MSSGGDYCRLHIRVKCATKRGQSVGIQGFGLTKGDDAVKLVTSPEAHPVWWTASPIVLPRGELINYKYCLIEGGTVTEKENVNPRLKIPEEEDVVLEDEFILQETEKKDFFEDSSLKRKGNDTDKKPVGSTITKLFLVCYHLPVVITRSSNEEKPFEIEWAESLLARSKGSISTSIKTMWIGTISIRDLTPNEKAVVTMLLRNMDCIPVFLDDEVAAAAYHGFCKKVMWPVFHNVDQLDQIHAAWNLPEAVQSETSALHKSLLNPGIPSAPSSESPGQSTGGKNLRKRSQSTLESESKVLEWNKQGEDFYEAFKKVNQTFAATLLELVQKNDVIWVHDYHLMLVPSTLRAAMEKTDSKNSNNPNTKNIPNVRYKDVKIIFFLHIPFPTSQIFRTLPESTELLQSMLCADLVGFHAFDHARHFLNAARRMLGFRSQTRPGGMLTVSVKDREVIITMSHVSIETEVFDHYLTDPETIRYYEYYAKKYAGKKIILGIDVCQRLSGIALKMFAMEKLFSDYFSNQVGTTNNSGIVLIQRNIRQGSRLQDEETTANDIRKLAGLLNTKYTKQLFPNHSSKVNSVASHIINGSPLYAASNDSAVSEPGKVNHHISSEEADVVVDYAEVNNFKGLSIQERIALYLVSDIFLLTCIREGLNLSPLEYIYSRRNQVRGGVVIASEFSTCCNLLNGALKVNPFSPSNVSDAILQALSMSTKDCDYRRQRDLPFIESHPSSKWTKSIVDELEQLKTSSGHGRTSLKKYPELLNINTIVAEYDNAANEVGITSKGTRIFVFDYGGTLLVKEKFDIYMKQSLSAIGSGRRPSDTIMETIKKLSEDPLNIVVCLFSPSYCLLGFPF
jgi:trehalose 6-phosphate synthase/phosphatase